MDVTDEQLRDFEKAIMWKMASTSNAVANQPGWTIALTRTARGVDCVVCLVPKTRDGHFSVLDRIFFRKLDDRALSGASPERLDRRLISEFSYIEPIDELPRSSWRAALSWLWQNSFRINLPVLKLGDCSFTDVIHGHTAECENSEKLLVEWAIAGSPEFKSADYSIENSVFGFSISPDARRTQDAWDMASAITWKVNEQFGLAGKKEKFRLALVSEDEYFEPLSRRALAFVMDYGEEEYDFGFKKDRLVAELRKPGWIKPGDHMYGDHVYVAMMSLVSRPTLDMSNNGKTIWLSELDDGHDVETILDDLFFENSFTVLPPESMPDAQPVSFKQSSYEILDEWKLAGSPKNWLA